MHKTIALGPFALESGIELPDVVVAYTEFGTFDPAHNNAVLVTHGYTSGPAMLEPGPLTAEGAWDGFLQPDGALDPRFWHVICMNMLGSSYGTTGPNTLNPATGQTWGPGFPAITLRDIVAVQRLALKKLGVPHLRAVVGPSYGGFQALQWALDYPDDVDAIGVIVSGLSTPPGLSAESQRRALAALPGWQGGWHGWTPVMIESMTALRLNTLRAYGLERFYQDQFASTGECQAHLQAASRAWAEQFDANSLVILAGAAEAFDSRPLLDRLRAKTLIMQCSTDALFPPDPQTPVLLERANIPEFRYRVLESPYGHLASGIEWRQVDQELHWLLEPRACRLPPEIKAVS
ncbi:MAG: alpha/beta fold hydrolase [Pigmentiphaga sp.]|nr:alpha/beta fold hydrolase [Pigmentiphaga sp.]